ncbi:fused response regulator/phosphatase [Marinomonas sp. MED121]|uniref:fused response regulator/phosphatase n=1 Tax=Marinomonas sp. MED121 TaxID=314277 RepID=UPI0013EF9759|nr:fused response regulator/phosphatase [Marinomonas sp. MED121]
MKLLVVDNEEIYRDIISTCASARGLQTRTAASMDEAFNIFNEWQPDLVSLEVLSSNGDGIKLIRQLKEAANDRIIPIMVITFKSDDATMNACIQAGADDFLAKPFNDILFNTRLSTHLRNVLFSKETFQKNRDLIYFQSMIEREHRMAHQVLAHAMDRSEDEDEKVAVTRLAATSFNGDIALIKRRADNGLLLFIGDFTGHGLPASIGALPLTQAFFKAASENSSVAEIAHHFNSILIDILPDYMFCAAYIILLNTDGMLEYWGGGMPHAFIVREGEIDMQSIRSKHMPLGILDREEFEDTVTQVKLKAGAKVVVASDGVLEMNNDDGNMLGDEKFINMLSQQSDHAEIGVFQANIVDQLVTFQGDAEQLDDITLLSVKA